MHTEPIRWAVYISAVAAALSTFLLAWSEGGDWKVALGTALLVFVLPAAGGEVARARAYSPATYDAAVSSVYETGYEDAAAAARSEGHHGDDDDDA